MAETLTRTVPVARPSFGPAEENAVLEALRSGWVSQGPKVGEFEKRFAAYVGAPYAVAVSSCTTALHLALIAGGVKAGDEVLCPSLSFIATANCIVYAGATPVFVDIDETTFNIDPKKIEAAITPKTTAILAVHQIGLPAAMDEIAAIAKKHNLLLVEDAACGIGAEYNGKRIGAPHSTLACFSFHPRKILTTGEGGMITTSSEEMAARMRRLRQHAMSVSDLQRHGSTKVITEVYDEVGYNYRMTDLQAAVGLVQLDKLETMLARRRDLAARYSAHLSHYPWMVVPSAPAGSKHNYQSYMVRFTENAPISRDEFMQKLLDRGVSSRRGIMASHREKPYQNPRWDALLPVTNRVTDNSVVLPLFFEMTDEEHSYVLACIAEICG
ncbi:MAG: DegT/DnrJ/EryC1/StrS family aminotransferase [Bryobacteraceae bacterium]